MNVNELPQYKCHKVVRAARIDGYDTATLSLAVGPAIVEVVVGADWILRHKPEPGGYFVLYADGYRSYSTPEAFEAGYHALPELGSSCGGVGAYGLAPATQDDINRRAVKALNAITEPATNMAGATGGPLVTDLPPHQLRVLQELAEVSTRHQKLSEFLKTELFLSLDAAERDRLTRQHAVMGEYVRILIDRVAAMQGES